MSMTAPSTIAVLDWIHTPLAELRAQQAANRAAQEGPMPEDVTVTKGDNGALHFTPRDGVDRVPILYFHGGGFIAGSPETHRGQCAWIAHFTKRPILSVVYPLAPEHRYPEQRDAARAHLAHTSGPVIVMGDSAGGAMAFWAEAAAPGRVAAVVCLYGALGLTDSASIRQFCPLTPALPAPVIAHFYDQLRGPAEDLLRDAADAQSGAIAPVIMLRAQNDPFGDDTAFGAQNLRARGRSVTVIEVADVGHGFLHDAGKPSGKAARTALRDVADTLNRLIDKG